MSQRSHNFEVFWFMSLLGKIKCSDSNIVNSVLNKLTCYIGLHDYLDQNKSYKKSQMMAYAVARNASVDNIANNQQGSMRANKSKAMRASRRGTQRTR